MPQKRKAFTQLEMNIAEGGQYRTELGPTPKRHCQDVLQTSYLPSLVSEPTCPTQSLQSNGQPNSNIKPTLSNPTSQPQPKCPCRPASPANHRSRPVKPKAKTRIDPSLLPELPNFTPFQSGYPLHTSRVRIIFPMSNILVFHRIARVSHGEPYADLSNTIG